MRNLRILFVESASRFDGFEAVFMRDTRRIKRKAFDHVGLIDFLDGHQPRPCQIRDISPGGARLSVFTDPSAIPEMFNLLLDPSAKVRRACRVAWRSRTEIGVQFIKPGE